MHTSLSLASRGFLLSAAVAIVSLAAVSAASAQCVQPVQQGNWRNAEPGKAFLTRAELEFTCVDAPVPPKLRPPRWHLRLFGPCEQFNCDWGRVVATEKPPNVFHATFDQGFATRAVRIQSAAGALLSIRVTSHFRDRRPDLKTQDFMERAPF
jgi:hypothetical protein